MSSLPLISHRLFVEAAVAERGPGPKPASKDAASVRVKGIATALPLELLEAVRTMPGAATRQLRASVAVGQT